jgi:hypothetical protein
LTREVGAIELVLLFLWLAVMAGLLLFALGVRGRSALLWGLVAGAALVPVVVALFFVLFARV